MMEEIIQLARERGCEEAEVFVEKHQATVVEYGNNRLKKLETAHSLFLALRVKKGGRLGFSTSTKPNDVQGLVERALRAAEFGRPADFSFAQPAELPAVKGFDPETAALPVEELVARGGRVVDGLRDLHPALQISSRLALISTEIEVKTSQGLSAAYRRTGYSHSAGGKLVEGQNFLYVGDGRHSARGEDVTSDLIADVRWAFERARINVPVSSGRYPVILTPRATAAVLAPVLASLNGQAIERRVSPFLGKKGLALFDPRISLEDDPFWPWGAGTRPMDDEGIPARRKALIDKGVIQNFLLDLASARALGEEPNGSARRSAGVVTPGPSNLIMEPGLKSYQEMLAGVPQGLLIDVLMGAWAGNPYGGWVNGNVMLGYKIEDGQVVGRVKDTMFSVNAFSALKDQVVEVSRERKWVDAAGPGSLGGGLYLPYLCLDGVSISARQG